MKIRNNTHTGIIKQSAPDGYIRTRRLSAEKNFNRANVKTQKIIDVFLLPIE
jgi:hypothetical protein